jgi:hypothetical protein
VWDLGRLRPSRLSDLQLVSIVLVVFDTGLSVREDQRRIRTLCTIGRRRSIVAITIPIAIAATAATAATVATATATTAVTTATATTAAATAFFAGTGLIHGQRAARELTAVERCDRFVGTGFHLDECETATATRFSVRNDRGVGNLTELAERLPEVIRRRAERQVTNVDSLTHLSILGPVMRTPTEGQTNGPRPKTRPPPAAEKNPSRQRKAVVSNTVGKSDHWSAENRERIKSLQHSDAVAPWHGLLKPRCRSGESYEDKNGADRNH